MQMDKLVNTYLGFQSNHGLDGLADAERSTAVLTESNITIEVVDLFCAFFPSHRLNLSMRPLVSSPKDSFSASCCRRSFSK